MSERILIVGATGESLPPPYAGIPKLVVLQARSWRQAGHAVAATFIQRRPDRDDLGAGAAYFFEYEGAPGKPQKIAFLLRHAVRNPALYLSLVRTHAHLVKRLTRQALLYAAYGVWLDGVCASFRPTVLFCEAALIRTFMALLVARRRGIPAVIETYAEIHDVSMFDHRHLSVEDRVVYWRTFLGWASSVISPSYFCARGPLAYLPQERVAVVYAGIDLEQLRSVQETPQRARFGLSQTAFVAGAVGAFTPRKGHDKLVRAAAILARRGVDIHVVLCGAGEPAALRALAEAEGVGDRVHVYQRLSEADLVRLYRVMDVYVDASNTPRACLGMALTEAMALGIPAVAANNGGLPEVVRDEENGMLFPTDDVEALAAAIRRMHESPPERRAAMGEAGARIAATLDLARITKTKLDILQAAVRAAS